MDRFKQLKTLMDTAEKDGGLFFEKNNMAAGTRFRNTLQQIKVMATELRKEVTDKKNAAKS